MDFLDGNYIENHAQAISIYHKLVVLFVRSDKSMTRTHYEWFHKNENGIEVFSIYFKKANTGFTRLDKLINLVRYVRCQFIAFSKIRASFGMPALTHIHVLTRTAGLAYYLKRKFNIPYIISEHWSGYFPENGDYKGWMKKQATKWVVRSSAGATVVSQYLKNAMLSHNLQTDYEIIPNVADTDVFRPGEKHKGDLKKIIHISGMSKIPKNVHSFIEVCKALAADRSDFTVDMIGDGPEMKERMNEAREMGLLDNKMFFYGDLSKEKVAEKLQEADFLVLYSLYENQPCVLIESIATGTPVIAPDIGGIAEHFTNNGLLVPKNDPEALKKAMTQLLDNPHYFNKEHLRKYAVEHFSYDVVGKQFSDFYERIVPKPD